MPLDTNDKKLILRYREAGDQRALAEITENYMPLARRLAARYRYTNEPMEDLVQVANLALLKAIQRFDLERDAAFSSYAVPTILGELKRYFRDHSWSVHVPRDLQERAVKLNKTVDGLSKQLGRPPTVPELAEKLGVETEQVIEAMEATQAFDASSLDAERPGQDGNMATIGDTIGEDDAGFEMVEYGVAIQGVLGEMPERTRIVLHLR